MNNLAVGYEQEELYQDTRTIVAGEKSNLLIRSRGGVFRARRAVSCLIEPEIGDTVLFCATDEAGYVLAVLERKEQKPAVMSMPGDLDLRLNHGRLGIFARDGVDLSSPRKITMLSPELEITAAAGDLTVQQLSFTGTLVQATLDRIKLFAGAFDSVLERIHQRVRRSYRYIEETDQVRAGSIDQRAEKLLNLRGGNAVINARELVKLDGEQIHVG